MKNAFLLAAMLAALPAFAQQPPCEISRCKAGDVLSVHSPKGDPAVACATKALQRYVGFVVGAAQLQATLGTKPALEHEFKGETKTRVEELRSAAGVLDLEQAAQACGLARHAQRVVIIEADPAGPTLVAPQDGRPKYWLDRAALRR